MAKRRRKKSYGRRKNPRRVAAARRAYKKSGLYKWNKKKHRRGKRRRKGYGKRKRRHGGRRKKSYRRRSKFASRAPRSNKGHEIMQRLINRGRSPQQAAKVAARIERIRAGKAKRYFEKQAVEAGSAAALSNVFANIGTAAHLAHKLS